MKPACGTVSRLSTNWKQALIASKRSFARDSAKHREYDDTRAGLEQWADYLEDVSDDMLEEYKENDSKEFQKELERTLMVVRDEINIGGRCVRIPSTVEPYQRTLADGALPFGLAAHSHPLSWYQIDRVAIT